MHINYELEWSNGVVGFYFGAIIAPNMSLLLTCMSHVNPGLLQITAPKVKIIIVGDAFPS